MWWGEGGGEERHGMGVGSADGLELTGPESNKG